MLLFSANTNSLPALPFQCYQLNHPQLSSLPLEPRPRGSQPHGTTCYLMATGFLHPVEPLAPLQAGWYPVYSFSVEPQGSCAYLLCILTITPIVLLILVAQFAEPSVRKLSAKIQGDSRSHRNCRHVYSLLAGAAAVAADMLDSLLSD